MSDSIQRTWSRKPFEGRAPGNADVLRFEFTIQYTEISDDVGGIADVSAVITWAPAPGEVVPVALIPYESEVEYDHTFSNGDRIYGTLEWRFLSNEPEICGVYGTVILRSNELNQTFTFSGHMVDFPAGNPDPPPHPPDSLPDVDPPAVPPALNAADDAVIKQRDLGHSESFPFLYLTPWPDPSAKDRALQFFHMPKAFQSDKNAFWKALRDAKDAGDPVLMREIAVQLINQGFPVAAQSPRSADQQDLANLVSGFFGQIGDLVWALDQLQSFEEVTELVTQDFESWQSFQAELKTTECQAHLQGIWNATIALNICLGYDHQLLGSLIRLLTLLHLFEIVESNVTGKKVLGPYEEARTLSALGDATLVLPDVFPLPPEAPKAKSASNMIEPSKPRITPYAFGTLETIHYNVQSYSEGEIQRIENILVGECREETQRDLTRESHNEDSRSEDQNLAQSSSQGEVENFAKELQKSLRARTETTDIDNYQSSFGTPTSDDVTIKGTWSVAEDPAGGAEERAQDFIKRSVDRVLRRVNERVQRKRRHIELRERETTRRDSFQNVGGTGNVVGIYRWVNKNCRLSVESLGQSLVFEVRLSDPAKGLDQKLERYMDLLRDVPKPPKHYGVENHRDISDDPKATTYYLKLLQAYGLGNDTLPPQPVLDVRSASVTAEALSILPLELPAGYVPRSAKAVASSTDPKAKPALWLGAQAFSGPTNGVYSIAIADAAPAPATRNAPESLGAGEMTMDLVCSVPVSAGGDTSRTSVSATLTCERTEALLERWKYTVFEYIEHGYQAKLSAYRAASRERIAELQSENPDLLGDVTRNQLFERTLTAFFETYVAQKWKPASLADPVPTQLDLSRPRIVQFLRSALDWNNLSADLFRTAEMVSAAELPGRPFLSDLFPGIALRALIDASEASILLPATSGCQREMLYFFRLAEVWPIETALTPCLADDIPILAVIKAGETHDRRGVQTAQPVIVTVPTSMTVLSSGDPFRGGDA